MTSARLPITDALRSGPVARTDEHDPLLQALGADAALRALAASYDDPQRSADFVARVMAALPSQPPGRLAWWQRLLPWRTR